MIRKSGKNSHSQRLSLDEMYDIFMGDAYKEFRERLDLNVIEKDGKRYVPMLMIWHTPHLRPSLYRHIIAEQLLQDNYKEIDWGWDGVSAFDSCIYFSLLDLWMNPLQWEDYPEYEGAIMTGRYAVEKYDGERFDEIHETLSYIGECDIIDFADHPHLFEADEYDGSNKIIYAKGMHDWGRLTADGDKFFGKIINGERFNVDEIASLKQYDIASTRYRLSVIAEQKGGKKAAELLKMLRSEWDKIKFWKSEFGSMTEQEIMDFENGIFHGCEDLLSEWENEVSQVDEDANNESFCLLTDECRTEKKESKVISELRTACKGTAVGLWKVIRTNEALGRLGTRGMQTSKIYRAIVDYFGELPYSERNFRDARDKK